MEYNKLYNSNVLSLEDFELIDSLLNGCDFNGIDMCKGSSLFIHGFVYDEINGVIIITHKPYMWVEVNMPIRFGIVDLSKGYIESCFNKNKELVLEGNDITMRDWFEMSYSDKISSIENVSGSLGIRTYNFDKSSLELINYLMEQNDSF